MYCGKCGANNEDGAVFCSECGERLSGAESQAAVPQTAVPQAAVPAVGKEAHFRKIGIAAVAVVAVVIVAVFFLFSGSKSYERPLKQLVNGINSLNVSDMIDSMLPPEALEYLEDSFGMGYMKDYLLDSMLDGLDGFDMKSVHISYKLEKASDVLAGDVDGSWYSQLERYCGIEVKDYKKLSVKLSVEINGLKATLPGNVIVYKVGGKWYVDPTSLEDMFSDLF
ncbi:MAG: zinc ribbon domain-containing protein [Acutalibacter sp.]|nr:zinc ribbon domain-containing protein [Acutalibacter sp.]